MNNIRDDLNKILVNARYLLDDVKKIVDNADADCIDSLTDDCKKWISMHAENVHLKDVLDRLICETMPNVDQNNEIQSSLIERIEMLQKRVGRDMERADFIIGNIRRRFNL